MQRMALHRFPALRRGACQRGPFSFVKENGPLLIPQEKGFAIASEQLEELQCLPIALPIARRCRVGCCYTICLYSYYPLLLYPSCRSAQKFPSTASLHNAASEAMPHSARSPPPSKRHSRLTIVRRGCKTVTIRRDSWRSHVHRTHTAQRVQFFKLQTANVRGRGVSPLAFLWGIQRGYSLRKENTPFGVAARTPLAPPALAREAMFSAVALYFTNME